MNPIQLIYGIKRVKIRMFPVFSISTAFTAARQFFKALWLDKSNDRQSKEPV